MTMQSQFNNVLKNLRTYVDNLAADLLSTDWDIKRKQLATNIVRQVAKDKLLETGLSELGNEYLKIRVLEITTTIEEYGLTDFEERDLTNLDSYFQIRDYMKLLLVDINQLSPIFQFSYATHTQNGNTITFHIFLDF